MEMTKVLIEDFRKVNSTERYLWHYKSSISQSQTWESPYIVHMSGPRLISESSLVRYQYKQYRVLLLVDLAPSLFSFDGSSHQMIADSLLPTICATVQNLSKFTQNKSIEIDLSIILTRIGDTPLKVIVHSYSLNANSDISRLILQIELSLTYKELRASSEIHVNFASLLKWCFFSLSLMNLQALPVIIFVTDTVNCQIDPGIYDGLIMQYCRADIAFNVISLTDGINFEGTQFGYLPDPSSLRFFSRTTGGHFLSTKDDLECMLWRETCLDRHFNPGMVKLNSLRDPVDVDSNRHIFSEYSLDFPPELIFECRIREGFRFISCKRDHISMVLDCHFNCYIEYQIDIPASMVRILLLCKSRLLNKIHLKSQVIYGFRRESKPSIASRVSWVLQNMKETEQTVAVIYHGLTDSELPVGYLHDKMAALPLSQWHRWFEVEKVEVVTASNTQNNQVMMGTEGLREKLTRLSCSEMSRNNFYIENDGQQLMLGRLTWEGKTKATLYLGFFGYSADDRLQKAMKIRSFLECDKHLNVFEKPLGVILVEQLKMRKEEVYSLFTFKPISPVIKAFMLASCKQREFLTDKSVSFMLRSTLEFKISQGFINLGETDSDSYIFIKVREYFDKNKTKQMYFIQNLLYSKEKCVCSEIYVEPDAPSKQDKTEVEFIEKIKQKYEVYEKFLYQSIMTFDCIMHESLRNKLGDEDASNTSNDSSDRLLEVIEEDDIFCYYAPEVYNKSMSFDRIKNKIYKKLYQVYNLFDFKSSSIYMEQFLKNSEKSLIELEIYSLHNLKSLKFWRKSLSLLYSNLLSAFIELADYYFMQNKINYFVRYIASDCLLIWLMPTCEDFVVACSDHKTIFYLELHEVLFSAISPHNLYAEPKPKYRRTLSCDSKSVLRKTKMLIERVYRSTYNLTCYQCILRKSIEFSKVSLLSIITSMEYIACDIQIPLLNRVLHGFNPALTNVVTNSVLLADFRRKDEQFSKYMHEKFYEVHPGIFMTINAEEKLFLIIGECFNTLSNCIYYDTIQVKVYLFQNRCFFDRDWNQSKPKSYTDSMYEKEQAVLREVSGSIQKLLAEFVVEFLRFSNPLSKESFRIVLEYLPKIDRTQILNHHLTYATSHQLSQENIRKELIHTKELKLIEIDDLYYCTEIFLNENSHTIWFILQISDPHTLSAFVYVPEVPENEEIPLNQVIEKVIDYFKLVELRVNKRLLLQKLLESPNVSSLLVPSEDSGSRTYQPRVRKKRNTKTFTDSPSVEFKSNDPSQYILDIQYQVTFEISNRLTRDEAMSEVLSNFSFLPFINLINDRMFTLQHNDEVFIFKFTNIEHENAKRLIKFEVFGIDKPESQVIEPFKMKVEQSLMNLSLMKLADVLYKNRRNVITLNDVNFIHGSKKPSSVYFLIPPVIKELNIIMMYTRQNLLRFLSNVTCEDRPILLYNYSVAAEPFRPKKENPISGRTTGSNPTYLGNTFGKALALLYIDMFFYDGSRRLTPVQQEDIETEIKTKVENSPKEVGNYLEIKFYSIGALNTSAFMLFLEDCMNQCLAENIIDNILQNPEVRSNYKALTHQFKGLINSSAKFSTPIEHSPPAYALFDFFQGCCRIINKSVSDKTWQLCLEEDCDVIFLTANMEELAEVWEKNYGKEKSLLKNLRLSGFWITSPEKEGIQLYRSTACYKRSVALYLEVLPSAIEFFSYNLSKSMLNEVSDSLEKHIYWSEDRRKLLNNALMHKLGIYTHSQNFAQPQNKLRSSSTDKAAHFSQNFTKGLNKLELKEEPVTFPLPSLTDPREIVHDEKSFEEGRSSSKIQGPSSFKVQGLSNFKMQGLYPLLKFFIPMRAEEDKTKQHGMFLSNIYDLKNRLFNNCLNLAYVYEKWCPQNLATLSDKIKKILEKSSGSKRAEGYLATHLSVNASLIAHEKVAFQIVQVDPLSMNIDTEHERHRIKQMVDSITKKYIIEICKANKLESLSKDAPGSFKRLSFEHPFENFNLGRPSYRTDGDLDDENMEDTKYFLKKAFHQTVIIVKIIASDSMMSVSAYCLEHLNRDLEVNQWVDYDSTPLLNRNLFKLTNSLRLIQFLYDEQVRIFVMYLQDPSDYPSLELLKSLRQMHSAFKNPPSGCQNRIYSSQFLIDLGDLHSISVDELFTYFTLNSQEYLFESYKDRAVFTLESHSHLEMKLHSSKSSRTPGRDVHQCDSLRAVVYAKIDVNEKGRLPFPIMISPQESQNKLRIRYFILNYEKSKRGGQSLKYLKQKAEERFLDSIKIAKLNMRRDRLWEKLRNDRIDYEDFKVLLSVSEVNSVEVDDGQIKALTALNKVFTPWVLNYLIQLYKDKCRVIEEQRSLVVFGNPSLFAHIIVDGNCLRMFKVKRVHKLNRKKEEEFVVNLVNGLLQWLWVWMLNS